MSPKNRYGFVHNTAKKIKHQLKYHLIEMYPRAYWEVRNRILGLPEPEMTLLSKLCDPKRVGIDIGANYGMYTYGLQSCCKKVISFEPQPHFASLLKKGFCRYIDAGRLEVKQCALSDESGSLVMRIPRLDRGYSTVESKNILDDKVNTSHGVLEIEVDTKRLDDFELDNIGFVKIDVEGHEEAVLKGALQTIKRCKPVLLIEVENRHKTGAVQRVVEICEQLGYVGFFLEGQTLISVKCFDETEHQNEHKSKQYKRNFIFRHPDTMAISG